MLQDQGVSRKCKKSGEDCFSCITLESLFKGCMVCSVFRDALPDSFRTACGVIKMSEVRKQTAWQDEKGE